MSRKQKKFIANLGGDIDTQISGAIAFNLRQSFFLGIPRAFTLSAASALFLEAFDATQIPYAYLASATFVTLLGLAFLKLERTTGFIRTAIYFTVILLTVTVALRLGFEHALSKQALCFVLFVWAEAEWNLTNVIFWTVANHSFTVREAKKVFGLISAGEILPLIVGGAIVPLFVSHIGVINLLWFSVAGYAAAYMNLRLFRARLTKSLPTSQSSSSKGQASMNPSQRRYVSRIAFILIANCVIFYFVDNFFLEQTHKGISKAEDYASFMGGFVFAMGIFQLLTKVFVSNRILKHWGTSKALLVTPITVFMLMFVSYIFLQLDGSVSLMFAAALTLKVAERSFATGINSPAFYVLFQPLSDSQKTRIQGFLDTIVTQVASLAGGALLLLIQDYLKLGSRGITGVGSLVLLIWIWASFSAGRGYKKALRQSLSRRQYGDADAISLGPEAEKILSQQLDSELPSRVTYALRLLLKINSERAIEYFQRLFIRGPNLVRKSILIYLEEGSHKTASEEIISALRTSDDHEFLELGILAVGVTMQDDCVPFVKPYLEHSNERVQQSALIALIKNGGSEGFKLAQPRIRELLASNQNSDLAIAGKIISQSKTTEFGVELQTLLATDSIENKKIAISAIGKTEKNISSDLILEHIDIQSLRVPLKNACLDIGTNAETILTEIFHQSTLRWSSKKEIVEILGKYQTSYSRDFLISLLNTPDRELRTFVLRALSETDLDRSMESREFARIVEEEARSYTEVLAFIRDLQPLEGSEILRRSLESVLSKIEERIYLSLQCYYDQDLSLTLRQALISGSKSQIDLAFELLENTISSYERTFIPIILDQHSSANKLSLLQKPFGLIESEDWAIRISELLVGKLEWNNTWLSTCARTLAAKNNIPIIEATASESDDGVSGTQALILQKQENTSSYFVDDVGVLINSQYFSALPSYNLSVLCSAAEESHIPKGQKVQINVNDEQQLIVILEGTLRAGQNEYTKGDTLEDFEIFFTQGKKKELEAISDVRIYRLPKSQIMTAMTEEIDFAWHVIKLLCERLQTNVRRLETEDSESVLSGVRPDATIKANLLETLFLLRAIPFFHELDDYILGDLISAAEQVSVEPGELIFVKGEYSTHLVITLSGEVKVHDNTTILAQLTKPTILGEVSAIMAGPRSASVTALTQVDCLILERTELHSLLWRQPELVHSLIKLLAERLEQNTRARTGH